MKIGFISDTHGNIFDTKRALNLLDDCHLIVHLGDVLAHGPRNPLTDGYNPKDLAEILASRDDIIYIRGNCDADVDEMITGQDISKSELFYDFGEFKMYATHGYLESEDERISRGKELGADLIAWGHSHIKVLEKRDGVVLLNPGSTTLPKDDTKSIGFYEDGIFYLIDLDDGKVIKSLEM